MIAHKLIIGSTQSGKTFFCNRLAHQAIATGYDVQIIDPTGSFDDDLDQHDVFCDSVDELLDIPSHVFLDEATEYLGIGHKKNHTALTKGRHSGWCVYVICQRFNAVAPIVRDCCSDIFIFPVTIEAAKELSALYGAELKDILGLRQGEYVRIFWEKSERKIKLYKRNDL